MLACVLLLAAPRPALATLDDDVDAMVADLADDDYQVRQGACRHMRHKGREIAEALAPGPGGGSGGSLTSTLVHFFDDALADPSENVVREAMSAAALVPIHPVWAHLKQVIQRERGNFSSMTIVVGVRNFAVMSRALYPAQPAAVNALSVVLMNDAAPSVRSQAAVALVILGNPDGIPLLEAAAAAETNTFVRNVIISSLAQLRALAGSAP